MIPSYPGDGRLIEQARAGDAAAFASLVQRYERPISRYVARIMRGHPDDAADLVQEILLRFYCALDRLPPDANLSAWLHRVARNRCISELRKRWTKTAIWDGEHGLPLLAAAPGANPEAEVMRREGAAIATALLERLAPRYRRVLMLRAYAELTSAEIGAALGISPNAAKILLCRARKEYRRIGGDSPAPGSAAREMAA